MSTTKKKGLGRGLTALFGDQQEKVKKEDKTRNNGLKANIADLSPNKYQPRVHFDEEKLKELAHSIKKNGIIQIRGFIHYYFFYFGYVKFSIRYTISVLI